MVSGPSEAPTNSEVLFVIECTATNGAYINELKSNYIVPTLEYFHGGTVDDSSIDGCMYGAVICKSSDCRPSPTVSTLGPYTCPQSLLNDINKLQFVGGRGEGHICLSEALGCAVSCFEDLAANRRSPEQPTKHLIIVCSSPPYLAAAGGIPGQGYKCTVEEAATLLSELDVNISIISPRKLPAFVRIYEKGGGELISAQARNYAKDPRHLVLLKGYALKERPPSPAPPPAPVAEVATTPQPPVPQETFRGTAPRGVFPPNPQYRQPTQPMRWVIPPAQRTAYPPQSALLSQLREPAGYVQQQMPQTPQHMPQASQVSTSGAPTQSAIPQQQQQMNQQRSFIWQGTLEWTEKGKGPGESKIIRQLVCSISANTKDPEPEFKGDTWPNKLTMQLMPKQLIGTIGGQFLKDSKSVIFHPQQCEALESLTSVLLTGFAGCVHFQPPNTELKVIILLYTPEKKTYLGFMPNNQPTFVEHLRRVIQKQKMVAKLNQNPGGAISGPSQVPNAGPSQAQMGQQQMPPHMAQQQEMSNPGMNQMPQQQNMMVNPGMQGRPGPPGGMGAMDMELEAARQQNLEKIQQLQQNLEAAQQQEAHYKSQMDIMSHLQIAKQQEQQYKQMEDQRQKQQMLQQQAQLQQQLRGPPAHNMPPRLIRPMMGGNPGLRHLLQQQPQYRGGAPPQPRPQSQQQQFDDVQNYDFLQ